MIGGKLKGCLHVPFLMSASISSVRMPACAQITAKLTIPSIGIGAGAGCDGQILVLQDLLGLNKNFRPRFARPFTDAESTILEALNAYDRAVKDQEFPQLQESYT